jgi:hypothetical protein
MFPSPNNGRKFMILWTRVQLSNTKIGKQI